ncbi:CsgG/HfaB family protein [Colwellia sp. TT2012]|uniref:CsgG/HfaB family protein n=1 Tax=Colwellia sp. TT2012 TaxID=1720342 RepID=UPI0007103B60|nr:CsgG/HfaB family protein [Colwellia sp. TT2012]
MKKITLLFTSIILTFLAPANSATGDYAVYPTAIFNFVEKGRNLNDMGEKISNVIFASLVVDPNITLVDREELDKLIDEATLNLSGMVNSQQANQIGQLTGAKIIVTGTIFEIEDNLMIVTKIIGTETSRVLGASVKGKVDDSIVALAESLSVKIANIIKSNAGTLVAKPTSRSDDLAALKKQVNSTNLPSLTINIKEHHINRASIDPAAETEMIFYSSEVGFEVFEKNLPEAKKADILIIGEGFTEFATRKGNIVGVKARLEVKAIDQKTKKILAVDRQTVLEVDLSEMIAAKKALAKASAMIAARMLPKLSGL